MSTTVTQTIQRVPREQQYLTQDFEESRRLEEEAKKIPFHTQIVWRNVALFVALHIGALIGAYQLMFEAKWLTVFWTFMGWVISGLGITAGAHRLWSHRSYKARLPARIILMCFNSMAFQNDIIEWSRDHRCHHKWTDTTADPHDTRRGFFFTHMGWLLCRKHPQVKDNGQKLDLSDLFADPVCAFQRRYYLPLVALFCFLLPTVVAVYGWGETPFIAFYTTALFRYCWTLHMTWLINSAAHYIGYRPYDAAISSVENIFTTIFAIGEGGHNYHHTFPQDYRTSEYSLKFNWTKLCIDTFASLGWVYDRKVVAEEAIARQMEKFGDHSGYKHP